MAKLNEFIVLCIVLIPNGTWSLTLSELTSHGYLNQSSANSFVDPSFSEAVGD
jgi:hypothetical protein